MAEDEIITYIKSALAGGHAREQIKSDLISNGWNEAVVENALNQVPSMPAPESATPAKPAAVTPAKPSGTLKFAVIAVAVLVILSTTAFFIFSNIFAKTSFPSAEFQPSDTGSTVTAEPTTGQDSNSDDLRDTLLESMELQDNETNISTTNETGTIEPEEPKPSIFSPLPNPCAGNMSCINIAAGIGEEPSIASSGTDYGIAWSHLEGTNNKLYFAKADSSGKQVGENKIIKELDKELEGNAKKPSITWAGFGYGVLWPVGKSLLLAQIQEGGVVGNLIDIASTEDIGSASISWTGSLYAIAWSSGSKTYTARVDTTGNIVGAIKDVGLISSQLPVVSSAEKEYGVAWVENKGAERKIYLKRFDEEGELMSTIGIINDYIFCSDVDLSWGNSNYGMAYSCIKDNRLNDSDKSDIYFMRVHSTGGRAELIELDQGMVEFTTTTTFSRNPSVVLSDENYAMVWEDGRDGNSEIYFNRIDDYTGTKKESEIRLTDSFAESLEPAITRGDTEYGIVWIEEVEGQRDLFFGVFE